MLTRNTKIIAEQGLTIPPLSKDHFSTLTAKYEVHYLKEESLVSSLP